MKTRNLNYNLYGRQPLTLMFDKEEHEYHVEHEFITRESKRWAVPYSISAGPSIIDKSGPLKWWVAGICADYFRDNIAGFIENHYQDGQIDEVALEEFAETLRKRHNDESRKAKNIGGLAHEWIEYYTKHEVGGTPLPSPPKNKKAKSACDAFVDWRESENIEFLEAEYMVYSKEHDVAGTLDALAKKDDKLVLIDYKTAGGIYVENAFQAGGYQICVEEEGIYSEVDERIIVRLDKETAEFEAKVFTDHENDKEGFISSLNLRKAVDNAEEYV